MNITILFIEVFLLLGLSAVCSGLNIALMSLDVNDLRRKAKIGNRNAKRVLPFRQNTHLSLAAILFSNIAAVSAMSLVLDGYLNGFLAGTISTLLIVVFGEVLPQASFAHQALPLCARLAPVLRAMIIITYPVAKPLQLLLDKLFSGEQAKLQSRHELGILIGEHHGRQESELDNDEVEIIRGALSLSEKRVRDIMKPLEEVFFLLSNDRVGGEKIDEIKARGWSRIPVVNKQQTVCFGVLLMKDLVDIDFDNHPVHVQDLPLHTTQVIGSMTALDTLFRKFIGGGAHLIPVEKDDRIVGIVTIEDLLEEIVGHEIEDETDRRRDKRKTSRTKQAKKTKMRVSKG